MDKSDWERQSQRIDLTRDLYQEYVNNSCKSIIKRQTTPKFKKWTRDIYISTSAKEDVQMGNNYIKVCSISFINNEMQNKTITRNY